MKTKAKAGLALGEVIIDVGLPNMLVMDVASEQTGTNIEMKKCMILSINVWNLRSIITTGQNWPFVSSSGSGMGS